MCRIVLAALLLSAPAVASAQDLSVAAASDLQSVMPLVVDQYQRATGHAVRVTYGSSGNFFAQIENGAPFDLFFSADVDYPKRLVAARLADRDTLYTYAIGRIVLWTRKDSGIDMAAGLTALAGPGVRHIAIANPQHAPYGRAAVAALQHAGVYERVRAKLVLGENISQAAQFVQSGNADVGILALSIALAPAVRASGVYYTIPADSHPPIEQAAVVLTRSRSRATARDFLAFTQRVEIVQLLREFGFVPRPQGPGRARRGAEGPPRAKPKRKSQELTTEDTDTNGKHGDLLRCGVLPSVSVPFRGELLYR